MQFVSSIKTVEEQKLCGEDEAESWSMLNTECLFLCFVSKFL